MMTRWLVLCGAVLLAGCSSTNITDLMKAAAQDNASVCASGTYAGASIKFSRTLLQNGKLTCNDNGMSVEATNPTPPSPVAN